MKTLLFALALVLPLWAQADLYYLGPIKGKRASSDLKDSVSDLVASALDDLGHDSTEDRASADYVLVVRLIQLKDTFQVSLKKYKGKKKLHSGKMKAMGEDELDTVVNRLVKAAVRKVKPEKTIQIGEITDKEETKMMKRTQSRNFKYSAIGPFKFTNLKDDEVALYLAGGNYWEITPHATMKLLFEGGIHLGLEKPKDNEKKVWTGMAGAGFGMDYVFSNSQSSPYIGGDFGYGWAFSNQIDNVGGFSLGLEAGMLFFRTADKQVGLAFRYTTLLVETEEGANPGMLGLVLSFRR